MEKKLSESRKKLLNPEKYIRVKKKKKKKKKKRVNEKKTFQNWEKCSKIENYFVTRVEKKSWIQLTRIQRTSQLTSACLKSTIETLENDVKYVQS